MPEQTEKPAAPRPRPRRAPCAAPPPDPGVGGALPDHIRVQVAADLEAAAERAVRRVLDARRTPEEVGRDLDARITALLGILLRTFSRRLNVALLLLFSLMFLVNLSILQRLDYVPARVLDRASLVAIAVYVGCAGLVCVEVAQSFRARR